MVDGFLGLMRDFGSFCSTLVSGELRYVAESRVEEERDGESSGVLLSIKEKSRRVGLPSPPLPFLRPMSNCFMPCNEKDKEDEGESIRSPIPPPLKRKGRN